MLGWFKRRKAKESAHPPSTKEVAAATEQLPRPTLAPPDESLDVARDFFALLLDADTVSQRALVKLEIEALRRIGDTLRNSTSLGRQVPRLPELLPRLMRSLHQGKEAVVELARQISQDPTMVTEILRTANSPYYRTRTKITSIERAIVVLGDGGVRETIARIAIRPVMEMGEGFYSRTLAPRLWEQANKCAVAAGALAEKSGEDRFHAFLAGLTHNVGSTIFFRLLARELGNARPPVCEGFRGVVEASVPLLSCRIAYEWELPDPVVVALNPKNRRHALRRVVTAAERLAQVHTLIGAERYARDLVDSRWIEDEALSLHQAAAFAELDRYAPNG
ncbi:MAG: hypothetical protein Kow006_20360 [Gammaproteobacteria bacterium]